jgi:hypothetical protein
MDEVNCECGYEWGVHSSWCPMSQYVIRDTDLPDSDDEYHANRFMQAEDLYR